MGGVIGAIVDLAEIVVGAYTGQAWLVAMGTSQLLGYAASLLVNPRRPPLIAVGANYAGTLARPVDVPATREELLARYAST